MAEITITREVFRQLLCIAFDGHRRWYPVVDDGVERLYCAACQKERAG